MPAPLLPVPHRFALVLALIPIAAAAAGCHHDHGEEGPQADEYVIECEAAADAGTLGASDENFQAVVNAEAAGLVMTTPASKLPQLTAPAAGTMLNAGTPPAFSFMPMTTMMARAPAVAGGACRMAAARRSPLRRALQAVASELVLERRAEAHCAPQSGEKYLLRLETSAGAAVYTAMLSLTSFTPDATVWSRQLASHKGETLTLTLERAVFTGDSITDGPYAATPKPTLMVAP